MKRQMVENEHAQMSIKRQTWLLGINRSGLYYQETATKESEHQIMKEMDRIYTESPTYGSRRLREGLRDFGFNLGRDHVRRLMRIMGLQAIYPKKRLSISDNQHKKYPYLLNGVKIERPNQVWSTDITFIPMARGFLYLVAIMDWYSRYVLSWRLSTTLDVAFCLEALREALRNYGQPEIFNSDQGCQFTSMAFVSELAGRGIKISMDGKGRVYDNIFIERLWRTVKYEEVYLKSYDGVKDCRESIGLFFKNYNTKRKHQALNYMTPEMLYTGCLEKVAC